MAEIAESVPEGIPQDVWDAALGTYSMLLPDGDIALVGFEAIARAILAERERCAKVAEARIAAGFADLPDSGDAYLQGSISSATIIATSIRQGSPK